jgi:hypothetical protein
VSEIADLEDTVQTPWPHRRPKGPRGQANRRRRQALGAATKRWNRFMQTGNEPSLPRFKCLEVDDE